MFLCDSLNFDNFKSGKQFTAYQYTVNLNGGELLKALPSDQAWYLVLQNSSIANILEKATISCDLLKGEIVSGTETPPTAKALSVFPLPVREYCRIQTVGPADRVEIVDVLGNTVALLQAPYVWKPSAQLKAGMYFARIHSANGIAFVKVPYLK